MGSAFRSRSLGSNAVALSHAEASKVHKLTVVALPEKCGLVEFEHVMIPPVVEAARVVILQQAGTSKRADANPYAFGHPARLSFAWPWPLAAQTRQVPHSAQEAQGCRVPKGIIYYNFILD